MKITKQPSLAYTPKFCFVPNPTDTDKSGPSSPRILRCLSYGWTSFFWKSRRSWISLGLRNVPLNTLWVVKQQVVEVIPSLIFPPPTCSHCMHAITNTNWTHLSINYHLFFYWKSTYRVKELFNQTHVVSLFTLLY